MKRQRLLTVLLLACMGLLSACHKEELPQDPIAAFVGDYSLTIDYTTYMNGELQDETGHWTGTMVVASDGTESGVSLLATVTLGGQQVTLYETTGHVEDGRLVLEPSTFHNAANGVTATIEYEPVAATQPLAFGSALSTTLQGYSLQYRLQNHAERHTMTADQ